MARLRTLLGSLAVSADVQACMACRPAVPDSMLADEGGLMLAAVAVPALIVVRLAPRLFNRKETRDEPAP